MTYQPFRIQKRARGACDIATLATFPAQSVATVAVSQGAPGRKTGHTCANCGEPACVAHGWFLRDTSRAQWFCSACIPAKGQA